jgi:acyl carrier protein
MNKLQQEIRDHIIDCLELDIDPEEIQVDTPLFDPENGLGLDSLEALEIVTRLSSVYGVNFDGVEQEVFTSVRTLSEFIEKQMAPAEE